MTNEKSLALMPRSLDEVQSLSELLAKSTLLPDALRAKPADVAVQVLAGAELGLAPMASIRGVHIVQGKPVLSADLMVALCLGSGQCEYFARVDETATSVTYETKRKGAPHPQRFTWSDEDTRRAGIGGKGTWLQYPRAMRANRAKAALARDVYPDVLAGVYDPDEMGGGPANVSTPPAPVPPPTTDTSDAIDAEIVSESSEPPVLAEIDNAPSKAALDQLADRLKALPDRWRDVARTRFAARLAALKVAA